MIKFRNVSNSEIKFSVIALIICSVLFFVAVAYHTFYGEDKALKKSDKINLEITKIEKYKGVITLNDSIAFDANLSRINKSKFNNRYNEIGKVNSPYTLSKFANNDTIIIIKDSETLLYKLNADKDHWLKTLLKFQ